MKSAGLGDAEVRQHSNAFGLRKKRMQYLSVGTTEIERTERAEPDHINR